MIGVPSRNENSAAACAAQTRANPRDNRQAAARKAGNQRADLRQSYQERLLERQRLGGTRGPLRSANA